MVDTFADARDRDILNLAEEMETDMEADRKSSAFRKSKSLAQVFADCL